MDTTIRNTNVVVIGELNVDIILNKIESFPAIGKEIIAENMTVTLGSSSAIFASNLSSLGGSVAFIGKVGRDIFAELVIDSLSKKKVDTRSVIRTEKFKTGATIVLNYDQDRAMVTYPGAMNDLRPEDIDMSILARSRHLHFSSCFLQPGMKARLPELFRQAKALGMSTSLDPQWDPAEKWEMDLDKLLPYVDVFLPNRKELQFLTGRPDVQSAIKLIGPYAKIVVVKDGTEGAMMWANGEFIHQPAFINNNVVDCIGAGDSFNAGFILKFVNDASLEECLKFGALTGAISTTEAGGTQAFENTERISFLAREKFNYKL
jgi:sugar/nucleoside kinase (ribokinase family)